MIRWKKVRGPRVTTAVLVGTSLGAGLFPVAPGTMGTLFAVPLAYWSADWEVLSRVVLWVALLVVGTWSAKVLDEVMGSSDNQSIVIDEVVGFGISAWTAGREPKTLLAAFVLFRLFDSLKPPPIRQLDRWSKVKASGSTEAAHWWGGFGVMADDLLAGVISLVCVVVFQTLGFLPG